MQIYRHASAKDIAAPTRSFECAKELRMVFNKSQHSIDKFWSYWTTSKRMILWGVKDYCCLWLTREFYFLKNRQARIRLNGETSKSKNFKQGFTQGAVLSPLLFMFFIDNLA